MRTAAIRQESLEQLTPLQKQAIAVRRAQTHLLTLERKVAFLRTTCRHSDRLPAALELDSMYATLRDLSKLLEKSSS